MTNSFQASAVKGHDEASTVRVHETGQAPTLATP